MTTTQTQQLVHSGSCEIRTDDLTRHLYATDASIYQITPAAVALPRNAQEAAEAIRTALDQNMTVIPRGAGTGLTGGAVGEGLVIDFSRHNRQITDLNVEKRSVRVGPGVVLDDLNRYLAPHGLWFGPDVATSSRATLGGMIGNNSSGAHVPMYGTTSEHILSLEIVLADGSIVTIGEGHESLPEIRAFADQLVEQRADLIRERLHDRIHKRWSGYGFDRYLRKKGDLCKLVTGSEGTLAAVTSAELNLVPVPEGKGLGVLFFATVPDAMQASTELLDLKPAAIEHIDRILFDQTRGQRTFRKARDLLELDTRPCGSILLVEFFEDIEDKLAELERRNLGLRKLIPRTDAEQQLVWNVRKQGLSLLTACKGPAKPAPGIEDVCVPPEELPAYVKGLQSIIEPMNLEASYYGHAASGLLHVRPKVNLHTAEDIARFRKIAEEVAALTKQFKGSLAAEHGVGIARTEFLPDQLGPELMEAIGEVKKRFDPKNLFNPGKIIPDGRYAFDKNLRQGAGSELDLPFQEVFGFIERDESFIGNLEQCNGNGHCRKHINSMCPTYIATGEEIMSTRGRANTIRGALEHRFRNDGETLYTEELDEALSNCLSCKACKTECPSNVDLALLKAELNHAKHQARGLPLLDRMISNADLLGRLNSGPQATVVNAILGLKPTKWLMEKVLGFSAKRTLPPYTTQRFDTWFRKHHSNGQAGARGTVILWDDTWVRYNEPNIGKSAVKVLEAAGYTVRLESRRKCCGRPAASRGVLDEVRRLATHNVELFMDIGGDEPIIFLEPSCYTMFIDEYQQLKLPGADDVAKRCVLFEQFIINLLRLEPDALPFRENVLNMVGIHGHCHAKALADVDFYSELVQCVPGASAQVLDTGCCGMAGAFGMLEKKHDLSMQVGQELRELIQKMERDAMIVASGTSCRHQIHDLTGRHALHMAELLAMAI